MYMPEVMPTPSILKSSPVRFLGTTATATGLPNFKKRKNWTETVKDRSIPVFIGSTTGLDWFSLNRLITGPSQVKLVYLNYFVPRVERARVAAQNKTKNVENGPELTEL